MAAGGTNEDNRAYLFRLQILLIDGGLLLLRTILDQRLLAKTTTFDACLNNEITTIRLLKNRGKITQVQYDVLFPSGGVKPTTSDLDITLIICLLRNLKCIGLNKRFNWSVKPISTDESLEADIWRLKEHRNNIIHISTTTGVQPTDFTKFWNDIEEILLRQSPFVLNIHQVINDFKTCPLDAQEKKRLQKELKEWEEYEAKFDRLEKGMRTVQEDTNVLKEQFNDMQIRQNKAEQMQNQSIWQRIWQWVWIWQWIWQIIIYPRRKKDLKDDLIEFYRRRHSKVNLSPLFEEKDTPLASFYIRPEINEKTPGTNHKITSLSGVLESGNKDNREIYLTADAGLGKTTFSKYLVTSWCHAHFPKETDNTALEKNDIDCMSKYEFVFLVLLRDSKDLCSIDDLIFKLIVPNLAHSKKIDQDFLQEILNREKCLIILDGLDEWTHPENAGNPCHRTPVSIPHRNDRKTCTFLTTTRPWKLGGLNLSSNDLGKQVILTKLSDHSARTLTTRTIQRLKSLPDEKSSEKEADTLIDEIDDSNNAELAFVPLLLMYIICLWCDGVKIAKSKCELYINVVELLLSRTVTKYGELQMTGDSFDGDIPECFTEQDYCTKYFSLLVSLGKLAYNTLSDEKRENTLVFDRKVADKYLNKQYITFCLHSGILTTESTSKTFTKKISKVSFSHKTVQEFFAALFISSQSDGQKQVLEKCTNVQSILDMSIICEFLSKMNSKMMCDISAGLMSVINEDEIIRKYRAPGTYMYYHDEPLYNIQKMFGSCLKQMPESENIKLCLQDFFIYRDTIHDEHLQRLSKQNQTNMKSLYIDIRRTDRSLSDVITLLSLTDSSNLQTLHYDGDWNKEAELSLLLSENLQHVELWHAEWTNYEGNLCERITALKHVQYLYISGVELSHEIHSILYDFISNNKTIKQLKLDRLDCKEHGYHDDCTGNFDLSIKHSQLEKLVLYRLPPLNLTVTSQSLVDVKLKDINLGESSLLLSRDMINIKHVELVGIEISAERFRDFINIVEKLPQSVTVMMIECDIKPETEYERVRNYISSQKFVVTQDGKNEYGRQVFEFQTTTSCDM